MRLSYLSELIEKFCGDGVEWREIGECVLGIKNISWKNNNESYHYIDLTSVDRSSHVIDNCENINFENAPSRAQRIVQLNDVLFATTRPMLKRYCIIPKKYDKQICSTGFCVLRANSKLILPKFLYYQISSENFYKYIEIVQSGSTYPSVTDKNVKNYKIPLPPLEVQKEIVRILDKFTNLIYELTRELTLRKKQYEYYRDKLLTFGDDVPRVKLMELCIRQKGTNITAEFMKKCHRLDGKIKIFAGGNTTANVNYEDIPNLNVIDVPSVIVKSRGNIDFAYYDSLFSHKNEMWSYSSRDTSKINIKFIYYYLSNNVDYFKKKAVSGKLPQISTVVTDEFLIPLPPLEEQERIVNILDKFDKLCNDISEGIPAEIEMRQKQYEYYRDKLLIFKEREN